MGESGDVKLFQVHGRSAMTAMTVEVEAKAASLNSNDCFVLVSSGRTKETLVWLVRILTVYVLHNAFRKFQNYVGYNISSWKLNFPQYLFGYRYFAKWHVFVNFVGQIQYR